MKIVKNLSNVVCAKKELRIYGMVSNGIDGTRLIDTTTVTLELGVA